MGKKQHNVKFETIKDKEAIVIGPDALEALRPGIREAYKTLIDNTYAIYEGTGSIDVYRLFLASELTGKLTGSFRKWLTTGMGQLQYKGDNGQIIADNVQVARKLDREEIEEVISAAYRVKATMADIFIGVVPKESVADILEEYPDDMRKKIMQAAENDYAGSDYEYHAVIRLDGLSPELRSEAIAAFNEFMKQYVKTDRAIAYPPYTENPDNSIKAVLPFDAETDDLKTELDKIISPLQRIGYAHGSAVAITKDKKEKPYLGKHFRLKVPTPSEKKHIGLGDFHRFVQALQKAGNVVDKAIYDRLVDIGNEGGEIFINRRGGILVDIKNDPMREQSDVNADFNTNRSAKNNPDEWESILGKIEAAPAMERQGFSPTPLESPTSPGKMEITVTLSPDLAPGLAARVKDSIKVVLESSEATITAINETVNGHKTVKGL